MIREAVEENTGERFTFKEMLVSNQEQALAHICLAILNSNEFVYLY